MIKEITATGIDVNSAIDNGALLLGCDRDDVQWEIIDLPKKGILGLKKIPAKVRVYIEIPEENKTIEKPAHNKVNETRKEKKQEIKPKQNKKHSEDRTEENTATFQDEKPALEEIEPTDEMKNRVAKAVGYVKEILSAMGLTEVELVPHYYPENIRIQLTGEGIGNVIGRRGETLDAIQYLASLVVNRGEAEYLRLNIDSGNYREKRARTLEALARKLANQAVRTGKNITLEPMNPYERRIIHGAVSGVKGATSSSVGVEPNRRVVITPIEGGKREGNHSSGNRKNPQSRNNRNNRKKGRVEDPPVIGGPVHREVTPSEKTEKSEVEQQFLTATTKRYGKIDI